MEFTQGRLRLVRSHFGCGFILTGTHPSITARENVVSEHAKTLANCVRAVDGEDPIVPVMTCNRAVAMLRIPEYFEAEEMGVTPAKACKRCRGCRDCSFRGSWEKEAVVKRVEDAMQYDPETHKVCVAYPWTEDAKKLANNMGQVVSFQSSIEKKLLKDKTMADAYNAELQKLIDRGAITRLTQDEINTYSGPVSYV